MGNSENCLQRGFTLLGLLVVMVILGLLAGYVEPNGLAQSGKAETKTAKAQIDALSKALNEYRLDIGHYPSSEQGLAALSAPPTDESRWQGPYLKKAVPNDPWGQPYHYLYPGQYNEYDLWSFGKDGQAGGMDEAADVTNWY